MKKLQQNFGSSLFLMEMILALLFLSSPVQHAFRSLRQQGQTGSGQNS